MRGLKTGGRKRGTPNKATAARQVEIAASGLTPLAYMLQVMRDEKAETAGAAFTAAIRADHFQTSAPDGLTPGAAQPVPAEKFASTNAADVEISYFFANLGWGSLADTIQRRCAS